MRVLPLCSALVLAACTQKAELTPPVHALPPASDRDAELPPGDRLPADTHPERYQLSLEVDPDKATYQGSVAIELTLDRPRESIWLHSRVAEVASVSVEREGAGPLTGRLERVSDSGLSAIRLLQPVGPGRVRVVLSFQAHFGARLTGLYKVASGGANYAFSQFEAISAREAFPCFDEPRFKTPFELTLRVPKALAVVANTRSIEERELPSGLREVRFLPTEKLPTYLVALAVGPFDLVEHAPIARSPLRERELPLRGVSVRGRGDELSFGLRETGPLLTYLEEYFGVAYPYDKLDLIAVPDFGAGAMENAGAITFRDTLLLVRDDASEQQRRRLGYVNAHELAHQWFGNLVTMPWWDDLWLNEAFATWMGTRAIGKVHPEYQAELGALSATHGAMEIDSRASARKIRQPIESDHDIENAFDAITYSKGGAVLSMFERYLGEQVFQEGLRLHMQRFRFGSADARDLVRTLAEVAHKPELERAFFSFLEQPGVPLLTIAVDCKAERPTLDVVQSRYQPLGSTVSASGGPVWQVPMCVRFGDAGGGKAREQCALLREERTSLVLETARCPSWIMPNAGAQGYYRWTLPERELAQLVARRAQLSVLEQMSLASELSAALRAGLLAPARAVEALRLLARSRERHVVETVLRTYALVRELLPESHVPALRAELSSLLGPALKQVGLVPRGAEPSGEQKLWRTTLVRALYGLAEDPSVTRELARHGQALLLSESLSTPVELPSELLELALSAALRTGGTTLFERALAQLFATQDGLVRTRLLTALGSVREPALSQRVLALALDPRLRVNERLLPLFGQMAMPETRADALGWLREHYDSFVAAVGPHHQSDLIGSAASFCSEERAREVESFFTTRSAQIQGGPRELALTLESIRSCAALATSQQAALAALYPSAHLSKTAGSARPAP